MNDSFKEQQSLNKQSEIRYANFLPTMGLVRVKYDDEKHKFEDNGWIQSEFIPHNIPSSENDLAAQNNFSIMLKKIGENGSVDERYRYLDQIVDDEWKKTKNLKNII